MKKDRGDPKGGRFMVPPLSFSAPPAPATVIQKVPERYKPFSKGIMLLLHIRIRIDVEIQTHPEMQLKIDKFTDLLLVVAMDSDSTRWFDSPPNLAW